MSRRTVDSDTLPTDAAKYDDELTQTASHPSTQHTAAVLRAPHQMQTQQAHASRRATKSLTDISRTLRDDTDKLTNRSVPPAPIPPTAKAVGPLGAH